MASFLSSLKDSILGPSERSGKHCGASFPKAPLPDVHPCDEDSEPDASPTSKDKTPKRGRGSEDCDDEDFEDYGGSVTPSTPDSSDASGVRVQKLHHLAECIQCCQFPELEISEPETDDRPRPLGSKECLDILAKYCPGVKNPSKRALISLKAKLHDQVRSMRSAVKRVHGGAADARNAIQDEGKSGGQLPPLDVLISAVRRGRKGALGKVPPVKCDHPGTVTVDGLQAAVDSKETKIKGARGSLRQLKKFENSMNRLLSNQDIRGTPMLLNAEVSTTQAKINYQQKVFTQMYMARLEWEMYLGQVIAMLSSERILPRLKEDMNRHQENPPSLARILFSLITSSLALDEGDIHACNLMEGCAPDRVCCKSDSCCNKNQNDCWEDDPCFQRVTKDMSPLDAVKNLLLVTRSNFEVTTQELEGLGCAVDNCTKGILDAIDGLRG